MPIIETKGSMSSQGYGQFARSGAAPAYIEDVFSTWLYTGNGSTQTITNGIDLATKGGLVWNKFRNSADWGHVLTDTNRGASSQLISNSTAAQTTEANRITSFNATGFSIGGSGFVNQNSGLYASWTFAKQPKFFDVVTYTGNGVSGRTVAHNLGSVPGCIIVKRTSAPSDDWIVHHRSLSADGFLYLNLGAAASSFPYLYAPTSTTFTVGGFSPVNANGATYVAYLFAHDAGGFGLTGTDNVISCGSYVGNGSATGPVVTLGYEPQWLLVKNATNGPTSWTLVDNMRGLTVGSVDPVLQPNAPDAELSSAQYNFFSPTATGFQVTNTDAWVNTNGHTYIYIAIRRGPMRTPTSGTSVFSPITKTGDAPTASLSEIGFQPDAIFNSAVSGSFGGTADFSNRLSSRLIGFGPNGSPALVTASTATESTFAYTQWNGSVFSVATGWDVTKFAWWFFRRAPGFFDEVCYTGTGVARTVNHNLGVVPEMVIVKSRSVTVSWAVWSKYGTQRNDYLMNLNNAVGYDTSGDLVWGTPGSGVPNMTSTVFSVGDAVSVNGSGSTYVAYLFASCPGVSKVGSYTGTGSTVQVNCGFTAGARFVLIKRTDAGGNWYVWDSARGIVAGNDPYLLLNSTAAEVTSTDWVDTLATGFEVSNAGSNLVNVNGGTYLFLAVS